MSVINPILKIGEELKIFNSHNKITPRQVRCYFDNGKEINFLNISPKERVVILINCNSNKSGLILIDNSFLLEKGVILNLNKDRESLTLINLSDEIFMITEETALGEYNEF